VSQEKKWSEKMKKHIKRVLASLIKEPLLLTAAALAAISMFFTPPDAEYISYLHPSVLSLLFCLMAVVAGLCRVGILGRLSDALAHSAKNVRLFAIIMTSACFFSSMLITNDVALITFVPLAISTMRDCRRRDTILTVVEMTAAANIGSVATPVGNPQNLFIYTYYNMTPGEFFKASLPIAGVGVILLLPIIFFIGRDKLTVVAADNAGAGDNPDGTVMDGGAKGKTIIYGLLFILAVLSVFGVIPYWICFIITVVAVIFTDRAIFCDIDYVLLLTFVCFFIFTGNLSRVPAVEKAVRSVLDGREILVSALLSQVTSNVPATTMLASFTDKAGLLLAGVNIGGVGTPIASMASLISYRLYCASDSAGRGRYMGIFLAVNAALLAAYLAISFILL